MLLRVTVRHQEVCALQVLRGQVSGFSCHKGGQVVGNISIHCSTVENWKYPFLKNAF